MGVEPLVEPLVRFGRSMRTYNAKALRQDAVAGLSVAVIGVPQAMAYAIIAGVRPEYGIYTLVFQCLIGSFFNSQPLLSVGPINTQSLLVASIVTRIAVPGDEAMYLSLVIGLTFLKGLIQIGLAELRMGNLVRYVSHAVVVGFTGGAGVLIAAGQVRSFLGISAERSGSQWPGLVGIGQQLWPHWDQASGASVAMGSVALGLMIGVRYVWRLAPGPLLAVVGTGALVWLLGWHGDQLPLVGALPDSLPMPSWPAFGLMLAHLDAMLAGALALALLGLIEAYAIGKSISAKTGEPVSANQEMFSQGLTSFVTSFMSCIPGSGSFSRSAINQLSGAKTALSGVFNAMFVLVIYLLFAPAAQYIPMAAIAAILFVVAYKLVDWRYFLKIAKSNRADATVCFGTFLATLFTPLKYAVFIGIAMNVALYLRRARQVYITEMVNPDDEDGDVTSAKTTVQLIERPVRENVASRAVMFLQLEGNLFFATADELEERFNRLSASETKIVILRLKRTHMVDATVMGVFEQFARHMQAKGGQLLLCGVRRRMFERMDEFGLVDAIGRNNVFETSDGVFASARAAFDRAEVLMGRGVADGDRGDNSVSRES